MSKQFSIVLIMTGMIIGVLISSMFIDPYNDQVRENSEHKLMIDLGVGSYNSKTGAFELVPCGVKF